MAWYLLIQQVDIYDLVYLQLNRSVTISGCDSLVTFTTIDCYKIINIVWDV